MGKGSQNYDTEVESYSARRKLVKNASDTDSSLEKESATATRNYITWDEVKKHNKKTDCWVVVNNNVYDLTNFKKIHPGGHRVIQHYAGQDASVRKYNFIFFVILKAILFEKQTFSFKKIGSL